MAASAALLAACLGAWSMWRSQRRENERLAAERAGDEERIRTLIEERTRAAAALEAERRRTAEAVEAERRRAEVELKALRERSAAELEALRLRSDEEKSAARAERAQMEETFRVQFRNLANEILGEQSRHFRQTNRESLDEMLRPFRENIKDFRERVESIYTRGQEQHGELRAELKNLRELNARISDDARNLTDALKGKSKVQGDWGETILDTILDSSGLTRGLHYRLQYTTDGDEGAKLRPDVVLSLPDGKRIVIDSKVSLKAYAEAAQAETEAARAALLKEHLLSVERHIAELSRKDYHARFDSPEFVIMFVPTEPAFIEALKADPQLWTRAYERKVILSSPTNLFALLKIVDDIWRRYTRTKNQEQVLEIAGKIYDQVARFMEQLDSLGGHLRRAQESYDATRKVYCTGNNNLVRLSENMRRLGVKVRKELSSELVSRAELDLPDGIAAAADPAVAEPPQGAEPEE